MPHYYDKSQTVPLRPVKVSMTARGKTLELWSGSGVFSKKALDKGTALLINACILKKEWTVHDLGCGIGVVGIFVKLSEPSCIVVCSDVSERAVELTRMNAKEFGLQIEIVQSDGYADLPQKFDTILFNPPYVAGRALIYRLIDEAYEHLKEGGLLQLVARHQKGGATLKKYLLEKFGNCDDSRKGSGYRVYVSKK